MIAEYFTIIYLQRIVSEDKGPIHVLEKSLQIIADPTETARIRLGQIVILKDRPRSERSRRIRLFKIATRNQVHMLRINSVCSFM